MAMQEMFLPYSLMMTTNQPLLASRHMKCDIQRDHKTPTNFIRNIASQQLQTQYWCKTLRLSLTKVMYKDFILKR
jgi:hypothetical protein